MSKDNIQIDNLYTEGEQWVQNLGEKTVHAKRMGGKFRLLKWFGTLVWLPFFIGPYITWGGQQAILFDIEKRQYHLFDITIFPQDLWMPTYDHYRGEQRGKLKKGDFLQRTSAKLFSDYFSWQ